MTLTSSTVRVQYSGDGATASFAITYVIWDADDPEVILTNSSGVETTWVRGTQYTISLVSPPNTATLTVVTSPTDYTPASGETLTITSNLANLQSTALPQGGSLPSSSVEQMVDQAVRQIQQSEGKFDRAMLTPAGGNVRDMTLPSQADLAGKLLGFDGGGLPVAISQSDQSATSVTPIDRTSSRTLAVQASLAQSVFDVTDPDFGADKTGGSSAIAAFQAAVDILPATGGTLAVPAGTYAGDLSTVTIGATQTVLWLEIGRVTYSTAAPSGVRFAQNISSSVDRSVGFAVTDTSQWLKSPTLSLVRDTTHTSGVPAGQEPSALFVKQTVNSLVENFETAVRVIIEHGSVLTSAQSFTAGHFASRKLAAGVGSLGNIFGINPVASDETGRKSTVSKGVLVVQENNLRASGPDDAGIRSLLDLIPYEHAVSVDGATTVTYGLRVLPARSGGSVAIKNGVWVGTDGNGSITDAIVINDCASHGLVINGAAPSTSAIEVFHSSGFAQMRIGSAVTTGESGRINFTANNASAALVSYAQIKQTVSVATAGAHTGKLSMVVYDAGTLRELFGLDPNASASDPVGLYVGGSFKRVTEGATDSGGAGFKYLKVPN